MHASCPLLGAHGAQRRPGGARAGCRCGYIVSPGISPAVVSFCLERGVPVLPGCATPSDIQTALEMGISTVKFFPAEAIGGLKAIKAMSAPFGQVRFIPTGGINEGNLREYLSFPKVLACGGSWMVPDDAVAAKDWNRVRQLARGAVSLLLGLSLRHVGINSGSPEQAARDALRLCALLGLEARDGATSIYAGEGFELMKNPVRGTHGHIAIACDSLPRARWHLERRGFAFNPDSLKIRDGKPALIYLREEIAGFAFHLLAR